MSGLGDATLDFGPAPGTHIVTTVVTGQASIGAGAKVEAWMMGSSTVDHNDFEHAVVPIRLTCGSVVAGVGFTITAVSEWRLQGTFTTQWVWA